MFNRRQFLKTAAAGYALAVASNSFGTAHEQHKLSVSQWSFHRGILGNSKDNYSAFLKTLHSDQPERVLQGTLDPRDICSVARELGLTHIDLVNVLFFAYHSNTAYLREFNQRANDNGVAFQVLMCDQTGELGASSAAKRQASIDLHKRWLDTAATLNCKQLRVNAYGDGSYLQQLDNCAEALHILADHAADMNIELLVENHGYASNNGAWLAMLIERANHKNLGVFTDIDNFFMGGWNIEPERRYDRVQGIHDLAPFTRGVSVKAHDFNEQGEETTLAYPPLFAILQKAGFTGFYSVEYEGNRLSEMDGTKATLAYTKASL